MRGAKALRWIGAALAAGCAISVLLTVQKTREAEARYPPKGQFVNAGGAKLHYLRSGSGRPVVLLHGNPGSADDWDRVMPELSRDHLVLAFDRPGHGYSERGAGPGSPKDQAAAIRAALAELSVQRPIMVGFSWGGSLALAYALDYPDELGAMVLVEATAYPRGSDQVIYNVLDAPLLGPAFAWTFVRPVGARIIDKGLVRAFSPLPVPDDYRIAAEAMWTRPADARATAQDNLRRSEEMKSFADRYPEIHVPTVIVAAEKDDIWPAEDQALRLHQALAGARLVRVPGAGHMVPLTHPGAVIGAVESATFEETAHDASEIVSTHCGACHRASSKEAVPAALSIFNLDEPRWYDGLTKDRLEKALGRMESKGTDEERTRFRAFVEAAIQQKDRG